MKKTLWFSVTLLVFLLGFSFPQRADAFPAFARKYNVPCSLCHEAFPKLNDFGQIFRDNGYQMMAPTDLPEEHSEGYWPISFRTTVGYQDSTLTDQPRLDGGLGTAHTRGFGFTGLDILSFGTLARNISYAIVLAPGLGSASFNTGGTSTDLESAWVRFDNLMGSPLLNLKIGKFEVDMPFSEKRSLTINSNYVVYHYTTAVPYSANLGSASNIAFPGGITDVNDFGLGENQEGVELMGHQVDGLGTFRYALALLGNNNLASDPFGGGGNSFQFYGHVTQSLGGWGATSGQRLGIFGFAGQAPTKNNLGTQGNGGADNGFYRVGTDISLNFNNLNVLLLYMHGSESKDLNCAGTATGNCPVSPTAQDASWDGGFLEFNYLLTPKVVLVYRYDMVANSKQIDSTLPSNFNNVLSNTAEVRYLIWMSTRTEVWLHGELNWTETKSINTNPAPGGLQNVNSTTLLTAVDFAL